MPLNPAAADAAATAICASLGVNDPATIANWKKIIEPLYANIVANIVATLPMNTVITVGSAATQTGPTTPVTVVVQ